MKNSEIGHYWMARQLSELQVQEDASEKECTIRVTTKFPTDKFTLTIHEWTAKGVQLNGADLRQVKSRRDFRSGAFLVEGKETFAAFKLPMGGATLMVGR